MYSQYIHIWTCISLYLITEDTAALKVPGADPERILLSTLQPCEREKRLQYSVVDDSPTSFLGLDKITRYHLRTLVPIYCDVIGVAIGHPGQAGGWADDCEQNRETKY